MEKSKKVSLFVRSNEENALLAGAFDECRDSEQLAASVLWSKNLKEDYMAYKRKGILVEDNIEALRYLVEAAQKPYVSVDEGRLLYSMGIHSFENLARDAKATRKIGGRVLINVKVLNNYIETIFDER